jgi:hypothetical protein
MMSITKAQAKDLAIEALEENVALRAQVGRMQTELDRCNAHLGNCQDIGNHAGMVSEELKAENEKLRAYGERFRVAVIDKNLTIGELQRELRILQPELAVLREVVRAVANLEAHELGTFAEFGNIPNEDMEDEYMRTLLHAVYESMRKARAAGYLEPTL